MASVRLWTEPSKHIDARVGIRVKAKSERVCGSPCGQTNILAERTLSKVKLLRVAMQMNLREITNFSQVKRIEVEDADEERNNGSLLSVRCKLSFPTGSSCGAVPPHLRRRILVSLEQSRCLAKEWSHFT